MRFKFGKNWKKYSKLITNERIKDASNSLKEFFEVENFDNKSFIDVGCGSGIFSISACLLGAKVKSFDFDTDSVECTQDLSKKILGKSISIEKGDILDSVYVKKLGEFDYVYSWGVLHHTGDLNSALKNIDNLVKKNGKLFISIYNNQGIKSEIWKIIKILFNKVEILQPVLILFFLIFMKAPEILFKFFVKRKEVRGMAPVTDLIDWLGGYPFETAKPEYIFDFFFKLNYSLVKLKTVSGKSGCNEFIFIKK